MKKVFTTENRMILFNMKNLLEGEGIDTVVVNEFAGGGVGDLPAFETWPELWVRDDAQLARAQSILQGVDSASAAEPWCCRGCQEVNDGAFRICWNCGRSYE
jgi:hypothetical protein